MTYYPIPAWHKPADLPEIGLMTDGCPEAEPHWYYVALPVNHPVSVTNPDNLQSYCEAAGGLFAMKTAKELIANGQQVLGVVRVGACGGAVEWRNEDRNTNGLAHHHKDFGSW